MTATASSFVGHQFGKCPPNFGSNRRREVTIDPRNTEQSEQYCDERNILLSSPGTAVSTPNVLASHEPSTKETRCALTPEQRLLS